MELYLAVLFGCSWCVRCVPASHLAGTAATGEEQAADGVRGQVQGL